MNIRRNTLRLMVLRNAIETQFEKATHIWDEKFGGGVTGRNWNELMEQGYWLENSSEMGTNCLEGRFETQIKRIELEDWSVLGFGAWDANETDRICREEGIRDHNLTLWRLKEFRNANRHLIPGSFEMRFAKPVKEAADYLREMQKEQADAEFQLRLIPMDMDLFGTYDEVDWDYDTWKHGVHDSADRFDPWGGRSHRETQMKPLSDDIRFAVAQALDLPQYDDFDF